MVTLYDKIRGCIAGSWVGSSMGAAVEGWSHDRIVETYGWLDRLLPYKHYTSYTDWQRQPGTTEDGIERQKLMNTTAMEKGGRFTAEDLVATWLRDLKPERMVYKQEPFDQTLLEMARAGVPARELGRMWPFNNVNSLARAGHTLGIVNAGDPAGAAADVYDVGLVYATAQTFALRWAAVYHSSIAAALRPDATVDSVLATALEYTQYHAVHDTPYARYDTVKSEVERALEIASRHVGDPMGMRPEFDQHYYGGTHFVYSMSQANEVVSKGLAIFSAAQGDARTALLAAVNFGRDTDCIAAVAAGLAGAFSGASALDAEWIATVNAATKADPYTNSRLDIDETAEGLFNAVLHSLEERRAHIERMTGTQSWLR
ncbi:MAG: ADP-ribosylglycohydrolase family protein [Anaerolineales bacterium]